MKDKDMVEIYCPDCRGRFNIPSEEFAEEEIVECSLCAAELFILQENPVKVRIFSGDDDF